MKLTYPQVIEFLYALQLHGTKLNLENATRLAAQAGHPEKHLRFIHVAGTNGKGSTCAMLESIYRAAGWRVGLFTSPHLVSFRERIQVDRRLIGEDDVVRLVERMRAGMQLLPAGQGATFFEVVTVLALRFFAEQGCDLVIWETGLGGRLDATNIVTPLLSIITNIQFDHEKWLGSTLAQIAWEKAGIIKPRIPVVTGTDDPNAFEVIRQAAERNESALTSVGASEGFPFPLEEIDLPLLGEHQKRNAAVAIRAVEVLSSQLPLSPEALRTGLTSVQWPGRLQVVQTRAGQSLVLDGAHNPAGAQALRAALESHFPGRRPTLILGILRDKDWIAMCRILAPLAKRILVAPVHSQRTARPAELEAACRTLVPGLEVRASESLRAALDSSSQDPFVVLTGSLLFVGEAEELLQLMPSSSAEQGLNEWAALNPQPGR